MGKGELTALTFLIIIFHMKTLFSFYHRHKKSFYPGAGILLSALLMIPYILLGTGSIVTYHDQLDGELLNYILAAKYLFTDIRVYPEIMNGLPAAGAVPPAPLFVLLYVLFEPFTAFMLSQWIVYLAGFVGMYLLLQKLTGREFISFGAAVIFMLLPFYPVYGLCIPGQPLLFYAVLSLYENEAALNSTSAGTPAHGSRFPSLKRFILFFKSRTLLYYLLILFYGAASSPVLAGFACLLVLGIFAVFQSIRALRAKRRIPLSPWLSAGVLLITYILCNLELVKQVLFPDDTYVSHKTELVLSPSEPFSHFRKVFGEGADYAQSYHTALFFLIMLCLFILLVRYAARIRKNGMLPSSKIPASSIKMLFKAAATLLSIIIICLFSVFYHGNFMTELRNASEGILKTFNLDRVCWLLPTAWCILAAYLLAFIADLFGDALSEKADFASSATASSAVTSSAGRLRLGAPHIKRILGHAAVFAVLGVWGITVLFHSALYPNIAKLLKGGNYYALDWDNFFSEDIFSQIGKAIGKPKEDYRVVSVGIYPAAAAYNGFYCLDGYSNNYPLSYKHTFRQIMEGELVKNDYVRTLFDTWGNRCYITTAEQANYYTFEKKWGSVIYDLDLNTEVLKELNCQYVFSAAYLMDAQEKGLSLLREAPFETEGSWYHIYVYEVR